MICSYLSPSTGLVLTDFAYVSTNTEAGIMCLWCLLAVSCSCMISSSVEYLCHVDCRPTYMECENMYAFYLGDTRLALRLRPRNDSGVLRLRWRTLRNVPNLLAIPSRSVHSVGNWKLEEWRPFTAPTSAHHGVCFFPSFPSGVPDEETSDTAQRR